MARKSKGAAEVRWREILTRQTGSGLSVRGFCAAESISKASFYVWRKRLGTRNVDGTGAARNEGTGEKAADNARLFIPLKVLDAAATLQIVHPLGYRIEVTGDVNPVALRHVIEVLDERAAQ